MEGKANVTPESHLFGKPCIFPQESGDRPFLCGENDKTLLYIQKCPEEKLI